MEKLTASQIVEKLNELTEMNKEQLTELNYAHPEYGFSLSEFAHGYVEMKLPLGIGEWEQKEQHGGMDQGSDWYSIKYFKDHDVYLKTQGWYASHHGTEFENGFGKEVKPVQKTITVFE